MSRLSLVANFATKFASQLPDPEKPGVFRRHEFLARYKLFPQTQELKVELERIQEDKGTHGFLDHVMVSVEYLGPLKPDEMEFVDENDSVVPLDLFVKSHIIIQQDALVAFWDTVNKGVEEKNSKKSRTR